MHFAKSRGLSFVDTCFPFLRWLGYHNSRAAATGSNSSHDISFIICVMFIVTWRHFHLQHDKTCRLHEVSSSYRYSVECTEGFPESSIVRVTYTHVRQLSDHPTSSPGRLSDIFGFSSFQYILRLIISRSPQYTRYPPKRNGFLKKENFWTLWRKT